MTSGNVYSITISLAAQYNIFKNQSAPSEVAVRVSILVAEIIAQTCTHSTDSEFVGFCR